MYEDGATQASPPGLTGVVEGTVLGNYRHVDGDAVITGLLCSQSEVEAVAGVVLHNEKDSRGSCVGRKVVILILFNYSSQRWFKRVHYLRCARREWQPGCWQEVETQILHLLQLLTACLHQHNLETQGGESDM